MFPAQSPFGVRSRRLAATCPSGQRGVSGGGGSGLGGAGRPLSERLAYGSFINSDPLARLWCGALRAPRRTISSGVPSWVSQLSPWHSARGRPLEGKGAFWSQRFWSVVTWPCCCGPVTGCTSGQGASGRGGCPLMAARKQRQKGPGPASPGCPGASLPPQAPS